jgi:hypothetical protein
MPHREDRRTTAHALTAVLTSDAVLDAAFAWVCQQRRDWSPNAGIKPSSALSAGWAATWTSAVPTRCRATS